VNARVAWAAAAAASLGVAYNLVENQTDAWPALLIFVVGGFVLGWAFPNAWVLLCCPLAGGISVALWRLTGWTDTTGIELPLALVCLVGVVIGALGIPTTLLGMYARVRSRKDESQRGGPEMRRTLP